VRSGVDGCVHRDEVLGGAGRLEPLHLALSLVAARDRCADCTLTPPQVIRFLLLASLFLLASLLVAPLLVAVSLREGRLRSLIPLLATLLLDRPVEAGAGLAITLPASSPEIGHNGFTIPIYDSRTPDTVSLVVIADIGTSREKQGECRQETWGTHGGNPIGVFTPNNRRHADKIPMPSRTPMAGPLAVRSCGLPQGNALHAA
jgi:hypothetical protein